MEMEIPYANEDMEGVRQVALGYLKQKDEKIAQLQEQINEMLRETKIEPPDAYTIQEIADMAKTPVNKQKTLIFLTQHKFVMGKEWRKGYEFAVKEMRCINGMGL